MAKIRERSASDGGGYQVRYYGPDGRRRAKTFARKKDAQNFANSVETDKLRGEWIDPRLTKTPFENYVAGYLETLNHLRPSSRLKVEGATSATTCCRPSARSRSWRSAQPTFAPRSRPC